MKSGLPAALLLAALAACSSPAAHPDAPPTAWTTGPVLPAPRIEPSVTAIGQQMVVIGGFDVFDATTFHITNRVDLYDTGTMTWSQLPDAPVAWTHAQVAAIGTTIYLLGGLEGQYTAKPDAYALDTQTTPMQWRSLAPIPTGFERGSAGVVVVPPRIYLLGGAPSSPNLCVPPTIALANNIYYDTIMNAWCPGPACTADQQLPDLPQPRSHPAAIRKLDGTLVVIGGLGTVCSDSQNPDVWTLPIAEQHTTGQWQLTTDGTTALAPMPSARGGCAYGFLQGHAICAGGEAGMSALPTVEAYDPIGNAWTTEPMMPMPRAGIQGAVIGQSLYVPGGTALLTSAAAPTDTLYIFSPLDLIAGP